MEQLILKGMETEEGRNAAALHNSIMAAKLAATNAMLDLCRGLKMMRDSKAYKALGFENFEEYSVNAVGIKYRMAANYIAVYEQLGEKMIAENADVGVTKLNLLAQISDPAEREEAAKENLAGMTVAEVKALVAEKNSLQEQLSLLGQEKDTAQKKYMAESAKADKLAEELAHLQAVPNDPPATVEARVLPADIEQIKAAAREEGAKEAEKAARKAETELRNKLEGKRLLDVERARKEGAESAREEAERQARENLTEEVKSAREAQRAAEERAKELLAKMEVQSSAETVKFGLYMEQLQRAVNGMDEQVEALRAKGDTAQAEKLLGAAKKVLQIKLQELE